VAEPLPGIHGANSKLAPEEAGGRIGFVGFLAATHHGGDESGENQADDRNPGERHHENQDGPFLSCRCDGLPLGPDRHRNHGGRGGPSGASGPPESDSEAAAWAVGARRFEPGRFGFRRRRGRRRGDLELPLESKSPVLSASIRLPRSLDDLSGCRLDPFVAVFRQPLQRLAGRLSERRFEPQRIRFSSKTTPPRT